MKVYDAVIIGAGPAGGQCARELAHAGFSVLIVEKAKDFLENNFSSGGAPLDLMKDFDLPDSVAGTFWNIFRIESTHAKAVWTSPSPFGPVLDFDKLREFLTAESVRLGSDFRLGSQYQSHQVNSEGVEVDLKDLASCETFTVHAKVLVDATGTERKVLASKNFDKHRAIAATGIEYHVKVSQESYDQYAHALNFFLGRRWMPQGYGWIFPMAPLQLKVGVIRYFQNMNYVPHDPSYKSYLNALLERCDIREIHDRHGKTVHYIEHQKDLRHRGPVIAIGDAISSINPLGWEGIRHAMVSGRAAAQTIQTYLKGTSPDLSSYDKKMDDYFGWRWWGSEKMMSHLFKTRRDGLIDFAVRSFSRMNNEEIMQMIFDYRFGPAIQSYFSCFFSGAHKLFTSSKEDL